MTAAIGAAKESERVAVLPPGDLRRHRSFDGLTLENWRPGRSERTRSRVVAPWRASHG
jgi:hypothetical protein